ncbi:MAG: hypothetical protein WBH56_08470 [Bacteroidota bacterium]
MSSQQRRNPEAMRQHIAEEIEQIRAQLERLKLFAEASATQTQEEPKVDSGEHGSMRGPAGSSYTMD